MKWRSANFTGSIADSTQLASSSRPWARSNFARSIASWRIGGHSESVAAWKPCSARCLQLSSADRTSPVCDGLVGHPQFLRSCRLRRLKSRFAVTRARAACTACRLPQLRIDASYGPVTRTCRTAGRSPDQTMQTSPLSSPSYRTPCSALPNSKCPRIVSFVFVMRPPAAPAGFGATQERTRAALGSVAASSGRSRFRRTRPQPCTGSECRLAGT